MVVTVNAKTVQGKAQENRAYSLSVWEIWYFIGVKIKTCTTAVQVYANTRLDGLEHVFTIPVH